MSSRPKREDILVSVQEHNADTRIEYAKVLGIKKVWRRPTKAKGGSKSHARNNGEGIMCGRRKPAACGACGGELSLSTDLRNEQRLTCLNCLAEYKLGRFGWRKERKPRGYKNL